MRLLLICGLLLTAVTFASAARILAVFPLPGKSHFIYTNALMSSLAARGHQVTVYSAFTPEKPVPNMKHVEVHTSFSANMKKTSFEQFLKITSQPSYFGLGMQHVWKMSYSLCEEFLKDPKIKALIASKEKFDLVITEALFGEESMLVFGHIFKAPTVNVNGFGVWSVINRVHGNALQISSYPDSVSFAFTNKMNFLERMQNLASTVATLYLYYNDHVPKHNTIIKNALGDPNIPPVEEMLTNISLSLINVHPTIGYAVSYSPNIVPVGGMHISQEATPLPKDIKTFLDSGKNAVIYFSLGTLVPVHQMPPEYIKTIVNVLRKLPYKVLWKIEAESVPDLPSNVMIAKWVPQQSVLAHPNCVLFITHGGLLSQQEVFHYGVPVVGIPFFGDQPFNVRLYEELGVGVGLDFSTLTEQSMYQAIMSVAGKPKYVENAKRVSELFRHRPMSPTDTAAFWLEYVIRHGGASHLRPASATMPWYSLYLLDIVAVVLSVLLLVIFIFKKILGLLIGCCSKTQSPQVSSKKKKN